MKFPFRCALVTGGGGFLGRRIVELLVERGTAVRVFGRRHYPELDPLGVEQHRGDIRNPDQLEQACDAVDVVFHVAAMAGVWGARRTFFEINVGGTRHVIDACRRRCVPRLVYTSSPSVVCSSRGIAGGDESLPYPRHYLSAYPASKAAAEREVLAANSPILATCSLRPHLIWGPGDPHLIPRIVDSARRGRLRRVGNGINKVDLTFVDNAALAHLQAAEQLTPDGPVAGNAYFIGDRAPVALWPWINQLLRELGIPTVEKSVPLPVAMGMGAVLEVLFRVFPIYGEPPMTRFVARQLATDHFFSHQRAYKDFGYVPVVDNAEGMQRLLLWLKETDEQKTVNPV